MTDIPPTVTPEDMAALTQRIADLEAVVAQLMDDPRTGRRIARDERLNRVMQRAGDPPVPTA